VVYCRENPERVAPTRRVNEEVFNTEDRKNKDGEAKDAGTDRDMESRQEKVTHSAHRASSKVNNSKSQRIPVLDKLGKSLSLILL
jgi:hypothetical protein